MRVPEYNVEGTNYSFLLATDLLHCPFDSILEMRRVKAH